MCPKKQLPVFRRGPVKYRFEALYELDGLAVVNARDVANCKNAFKILMFPQSRMFQAESPKEKVGWKLDWILLTLWRPVVLYL